MTENPVSKTKKIFCGWYMVLSATILNIINGGTFLYGFTVFFNPIRNTFGWSATATSVAFSFRGLESGALEVVVGFLADKLGPRKLMIPGWIVAGLGFFWLGRINSLWEFYASFILITLGMSFGAFITIDTAIANWFSRKRSRAMTVVRVGYGISGMLVPLMALLIENYGWRNTTSIIGIIFIAVCIPLSLLMRHKPSQYGYLPDGDMPLANLQNQQATHHVEKHSLSADFTVRQALQTRAFWMISFAMFFQHVATGAIVAHIAPSLESVKISTEIAALAVTGMTISSLIGRIGFGFWGDFGNKRYLLAIALTLQTVGVFIFSLVDASRMWLIVLFLLTFSPGFGGTIPVRLAMVADYFGTKNIGAILGCTAFIGMLGGAISPVIAGWLFETMDSYTVAWKIFAAVSIPSIFMILLARPPQVKLKAQIGLQ